MYDVKALCNKLNEAKIPCTDWDQFGRDTKEASWTPKNNNIASLKNLPAENMKKLVEMDYSHFTSFNSIYQEWGRKGYLKFVPYISDDNGNPTLTIRHDRHLHMFRGYHFQVSGTVDGIGSYEIGSYRTDFLLKRGYLEGELWSNSVLVNMLCYAAVIDTAFVFDNFRDWFFNCTEIADGFMKKSLAYWGTELKYSWHDFDSYFDYKHTEWASIERRLYRVVGKKGILCEFAFGDKTIQVRYSENGKELFLTLNVPDAFDGIEDIDSWGEDDLDCFREEATLNISASGFDERKDLKMLLIMVLALAGIRLNWMACYPISKVETIKGTNRPGVKEVSTLNDIAECEPDAF